MSRTMTALQRNISILATIFVASLVALVFTLPIIANGALLTQTLDLGDQNSDVTSLQTYLTTNASYYPSGLVTGYYGELTKAGVERFQTAYGIVTSGTPATTGYGRVGPLTLASINSQLSGGTNTVGDVYAPAIRSVDVSTGNNNAAVSWTASEASFGKVYYDTTPIRISNIFDVTGVFSGEPVVSGTLAQYDANARATHTVNINGLSSNTTYYYLVVAYDATKNISITLPASFRTK